MSVRFSCFVLCALPMICIYLLGHLLELGAVFFEKFDFKPLSPWSLNPGPILPAPELGLHPPKRVFAARLEA